MDIEKARTVVLHSAVEIANRHGYEGANQLDACHAVAKDILAIFEGKVPEIPLVVIPSEPAEFTTTQLTADNDQWEHVIPLPRRIKSDGLPEDARLASDYDIIRMRSAAAAKMMFGVPEAA